MPKIILIFQKGDCVYYVSSKNNHKINSFQEGRSKMKKLILAATFAALTITTPTTVSAAKANVRYSTGIVTGAKSITTTDGNVWRTKRKLHLCKGANVQVKFDTKGTRRKKDDAILKVKKQANPEISIPISDVSLVYTDSLGYTTLQLKDYGCINDDPNNISYQEIKQMVNSYYVSVREAIDSVTVTEPNGNSWSIRK